MTLETILCLLQLRYDLSMKSVGGASEWRFGSLGIDTRSVRHGWSKVLCSFTVFEAHCEHGKEV